MVSTKLIRGLYNIRPEMRGGIVTIGNFDGVHIGHQQLLAQVVARARTLNVPSVVITFEPHPFEFFAKDNVTIPRLTRMREKFLALAACQVDYVLILPFNQSLADLSASTFAEDILNKKLAAKEIFVGDDFHFGHERKGDCELLRKLGFKVHTMDTLLIAGSRVSSTRVRQALAQADYPLVKRLLGHPFTLDGRIRTGHKRGREWGFPTANIYLHRKLTPVKGVYSVLMHGITDQPLPGVANIGVRPTVDGTRTLLEVHLLAFDQQIYGRYVRVEFCEKIREEKRFDNIELLKAAIAKDVSDAKIYFKELGAK